MEQLDCKTVFTIPVFGGIEVTESIVVTWIIMAVVVLLSILATRNLSVDKPGKIQLLLESAVQWAQGFFKSTMGPEGDRYIPYLMTVLIYLAVANLIGILGFKPPTKDLNVTAGLAIMSMILIEGSGFRVKGFGGKMKAFAQPIAVVLPINVMEVLTRPISLCMRLFGNVLGSFVVMELIKLLVPVLVPIPFTCYFDIFDGLLQAYVFVFLTALFIGEQVEE